MCLILSIIDTTVDFREKRQTVIDSNMLLIVKLYVCSAVNISVFGHFHEK